MLGCSSCIGFSAAGESITNIVIIESALTLVCSLACVLVVAEVLWLLVGTHRVDFSVCFSHFLCFINIRVTLPLIIRESTGAAVQLRPRKRLPIMLILELTFKVTAYKIVRFHWLVIV